MEYFQGCFFQSASWPIAFRLAELVVGAALSTYTACGHRYAYPRPYRSLTMMAEIILPSLGRNFCFKTQNVRGRHTAILWPPPRLSSTLT